MVEIKRKIHIPIYGGWMIVVISDEENVCQSALRHFKVNDVTLMQNSAVCLSSDTCSTYPVLFSGKITPGLIAHEAKHVLNNLFLDLGIKLDLRNDEAEAYVLCWLVNRIWEVYIKFLKLQ